MHAGASIAAARWMLHARRHNIPPPQTAHACLCGLFCCALDVVRADIKGLPASFVAQLQAAGVTTGRSVVHHTLQAPDGTSKLLLQLAEGRLIEAVGIPVQEGGKQRLTVCVSSQVRLLAQSGVF
jgi:hypothetical protein